MIMLCNIKNSIKGQTFQKKVKFEQQILAL